MPIDINLRQIREDYRAHREEYRREIAQHVDPKEAGARNTDKSAIDIAQSIFKTSTWLNGGGIIAIPAVVGLFKVRDTTTIAMDLLVPGGIFSLGLLTSLISAIMGFFALANRADMESSDATAMKLRTNLNYYPPDDPDEEKCETSRKEQEIEISKWQQKTTSYYKLFYRFKAGAIIFIVISTVCFVGGNYFGARAMLKITSSRASVSSAVPMLDALVPLYKE